MQTSEQINELAAALAKAQAELKPAAMNATNPFLKNKYADLNAVTEAVRPVLAAHGLSYVQMPTTSPDGIGLTTRLMHNSGQWLEDTFVMPIPENERGKSVMQVAGSAISYARRYALSAMLGVVADEDADGNQPEPRKQPAQNGRKPEPATNGDDKPGKFDRHIAANVPYYTAPQHVFSTRKLLGIEYPDNTDKAKAATIVLEEYAKLRADGVEQDEAIARVAGGPAERLFADEPEMTGAYIED